MLGARPCERGMEGVWLGIFHGEFPNLWIDFRRNPWRADKMNTRRDERSVDGFQHVVHE